MVGKEDLHEKAVALRNRGFTYGEILEKINFKVSNSTISCWCSGIELTPSQKDRIKEKQRNFKLIKHLISKSIKDEEGARAWAKEKAELIASNNLKNLILSGTMLYWAEGYGSTGKSAGFTNTDPQMIKIMMKFFREVLGVEDRKIKIMVRIDKRNDIGRAVNYWSKTVKLPLSNFHKTEILETKNNKYPNGICRITVYDVSVRRKIDNLLKLIKDKWAPVAQRIEQHTPKVKAVGSIPTGGTIKI